jgi:hypothetical protein
MPLFGPKKPKKQWYFVPVDSAEPIRALTAFPVIVGRGMGCDVRVDDPRLADEHLQISSVGQSLAVRDSGTATGTTVDGQPTRRAWVGRVNGAVVTAGMGFTFLLRFCGDTEAEQYGREMSQATHPTGESPSDDRTWIVHREGLADCPMTKQEFTEAAERGEIGPHDLAWQRDTPAERWEALAVVPDLFPDTGSEPDGPRTGPWVVSREGRIICPHCWWRFDSRDFLYVSEAPELRGDPVAGPDEQLRFSPEEYDPHTGDGMDAYGHPCGQLACPRCHLALPQELRTASPLFVSIVGAPASGKSFFLAAMSRRLRDTMPSSFFYYFGDVDGATNSWLNEYENLLFDQADPAQPQKIDKTLMGGEMYRSVRVNGVELHLPRPCLFSLRPQSLATTEPSDHKLVVFYDNAGEQFLPGADVLKEPGTQHLVRAEGIIFMVDPVLDPGLRRAVTAAGYTIGPGTPTSQQHVLLYEMISRIRRHEGLRAAERLQRPLVLCVSKADLLGSMVDFGENPWRWDREAGVHLLDMDRLVAMSFHVRALLLEYAPLIVRTLEALADRVIYVPVSALGHCPAAEPATLPAADASSTREANPYAAVRPCDIKTKWVEVPLLYLLCCLGLIGASHTQDESCPEAQDYQKAGLNLRITVPGTEEIVDVPPAYGGYLIQAPISRVRFRVPRIDGVQPL